MKHQQRLQYSSSKEQSHTHKNLNASVTQSPCNSHVDAIWLEVTSAWLKFMRMCPQVLTKAALMSYERLHVFEGIVDRDWNPHGSGPKYASKLLCAWQFDKITSGGCSATCASRRHDLLLWPPLSREWVDPTARLEKLLRQ